VQKIGGRNLEKTGRKRSMVERRKTLKRSGLPSKGRLCCRRGTTTAQKLVKDLLATFISFFQRGDEPS